MLAKTLTRAVIGLERALVEVDIGPGLPAFTIVGLPDATVQEAKERVRAAVKNSVADSRSGRSPLTSRPRISRKKGPAYDPPCGTASFQTRNSQAAATSKGIAVKVNW